MSGVTLLALDSLETNKYSFNFIVYVCLCHVAIISAVPQKLFPVLCPHKLVQMGAKQEKPNPTGKLQQPQAFVCG